jgi:hypothetical protein
MPLDSALEWFVDVRCRGRQLPSDPEGIRSWLLQHSEEIQSELETMAKELTAGIDRGWPFVKEIGARSNGVSIKIACSAARRLDAREIARILLNLKKEWPTLIEALPAYSAEKAA